MPISKQLHRGDTSPSSTHEEVIVRTRDSSGQQYKVALLAVFLLSGLTLSSAAQSGGRMADVKNVASRLELFVDDQLIERLEGQATLRLHHPTPQEIALVHDEPWEAGGGGYHSIFQDGPLYRMYYRANRSFCYAESDDGSIWRKPRLGLHAFKGSKENNIILLSGPLGDSGLSLVGDNAAFFLDGNPAAGPDERYKAVAWVSRPKAGLAALKSSDGIRWSLLNDEPIIKDGAFDSQNLAFWDSENQQYRAYWRVFENGKTRFSEERSHRAIRTGISPDFRTWTNLENLAYVDSPPEELYTNVVKPYPRAPHILIGFPARYLDRDWSDSMVALPEREFREKRSREGYPRYGTALTESMMMASRDGVTFKRWNEAFLRPGIERPGTWFYAHQFIAWHVVETKSALEGAPDELSIYAWERSPWGPDQQVLNRLRRYTLRRDGFVSVHAPASGGELVTRPLTFTGETLVLNLSTSAAGGLQVEIQDANGVPLPGFHLADCPVVFGDALERRVTWRNDARVGSLAGRPVRLRFVLQDANLFSYRFQ